MTIIKIGVPNRWDWTVMVRGLAGGEASASFTSAPSVAIPLIGKITWPNTYAHILERNLSFVLTVPIALALKILSPTTYECIRERNRTLACSVLIALLTDMPCSFTYWNTTSNLQIKILNLMFVVIALPVWRIAISFRALAFSYVFVWKCSLSYLRPIW